MKFISTVVLCLLVGIVKSDWISFEGVDYFYDFGTIGDHSFVSDRCAAINSSLAYVTDDKIQEFLARLADKHAYKPYCFFIGLTRTAETPWFHWSNGANLTAAQSHWALHEPNNKFFKHTGTENCVIMGKPSHKESDFLWHDVKCTQHCSYFCQRETSTQSTLSTISSENPPMTRDTKPAASTEAPTVSQAMQKPATAANLGADETTSNHSPGSQVSVAWKITTGTIAGTIVISFFI